MKILLMLLIPLTLLTSNADAEEQWVFFGTTTNHDSKGIYVSRFDSKTGKLGKPKLAAEAIKPGFLAVHPGGKYLYAVASEIPGHDHKETGGVSAYQIDRSTGKLSLINQQPSGGPGPCHVSLDSKGRCALVANYAGGSCSCLGVNRDGSLKKPGTVIQHTGSSVDPRRQKEPHAHSANSGPKNQYAFVADLGLDKVLIYQLDPDNAKLTPHGAGKVPPGGGPRHFFFHPNGKWAYTNNEMLMTVTAFAFDPEKGSLTPFQNLGTVPKGTDFKGLSTAEIQVHKSGKFLYVSNRGDDTITAFSINPKTGRLTLVEREPIQGKTPRNFGIDLSGKFLLAAGQDSHTISVFRIHQKTGGLKYTGNQIHVPSPICVKFLATK